MHAMRRFPLSQFTQPPSSECSTVRVLRDHWWPVSDAEEVYFYGTESSPYSSTQCNLNRLIAERHSGRFEEFKEVRQIPLMFVPLNISDYLE